MAWQYTWYTCSWYHPTKAAWWERWLENIMWGWRMAQGCSPWRPDYVCEWICLGAVGCSIVQNRAGGRTEEIDTFNMLMCHAGNAGLRMDAGYAGYAGLRREMYNKMRRYIDEENQGLKRGRRWYGSKLLFDIRYDTFHLHPSLLIFSSSPFLTSPFSLLR